MQAGAGSLVDLNKLNDTQSLLQQYENIGLAYQNAAAGQASSVAGDQEALQQAEDADLHNVGSSLGSLMSNQEMTALLGGTVPTESYGEEGQPLGLNGGAQSDAVYQPSQYGNVSDGLPFLPLTG